MESVSRCTIFRVLGKAPGIRGFASRILFTFPTAGNLPGAPGLHFQPELRTAVRPSSLSRFLLQPSGQIPCGRVGELPARSTRRNRGAAGLQLPGCSGRSEGVGTRGRSLGKGGCQGNPAPLHSSSDTKPDFTT